MAQIDMTADLAQALLARMTREYGETSASNFALDILLDAANAELAVLRGQNATLQERCRRAEAANADLKATIDPKRAEAAARQKRKAPDGPNAD